ARTAAQMSDTSESALPADEPGLQAYYRFDDGAGTKAIDSTSNGLDGTLRTTGSDLPAWAGPAAASIDLGGDGATGNSAGPRTGRNNLQNHPVVVTTSDGQLMGRLSGSLPDSNFRIEIFAASQPGDAEVYLGAIAVTTDATGQAIFAVPFAVPAGTAFV